MAAESLQILADSAPEMNLGTEPISKGIEIDTSAPFESVKEAANRFGGMGFWKPNSPKLKHAFSQREDEATDIVKMEEEAAQLGRDLIRKERETLDVLKELETTRMIVEELKLKLQKSEESECSMNFQSNGICECGLMASSPAIILQELQHAKMNLTKATTEIDDLRATVDEYNDKIGMERTEIGKTRRRLSFNTSKVSSLGEELNQTRQKLRLSKDSEVESGCPNPLDVVMRAMQKLSYETEQFKKAGEDSRLSISRALSQIEHRKSGIRLAEIRLIAAKKMKNAARASEVLALAEIKSLSDRQNPISEGVTLTVEEYSSLISRVLESREAYNDTAVADMLEDDPNILKKVEEASEEVEISKKSLEEAMGRVRAADSGKLAVEEALQKWRSEHFPNRRFLHNSAKFKNSWPSVHHEECNNMIQGNVLYHAEEGLKPVQNQTLSIGQILSRKLIQAQEYESSKQEEKSSGKLKASLGQMLRKHNNSHSDSDNKDGKENAEFPSKAKRFSFSGIRVLLKKQMKNERMKRGAFKFHCVAARKMGLSNRR